MPNTNIAAQARTEPRSTLVMVVHARYPIGEPRVQREACAARDVGWRVLVVCLREPGEADSENLDGIEVMRMPVRHQRGASFGNIVIEYVNFAWRAAWAVARMGLQWRACVVHVNAPPDFLVVAALVPKLRGARVVLDIHDLSRHMFAMRFGGFLGRVSYSALALIERVACGLADQVITVHEPYRREINDLGVPAEKLTVIMNAVDEGLLQRVRRKRSAQLGKTPSFTVAYHGTITPSYGVDLLVEALPQVREHVPGVRCVVLGEGDALPGVRALAADLGVAELIDFSGGYVPIEQALATVAGADCGVIPNRPSGLNRFALSSKLFEYVALDVPAVVACLETLASHFGPDEVTFFDPGDANSLASAITWVALNPTEARARCARARTRSRAYSWAEHSSRYLNVLGVRATNRDGVQARNCPPILRNP